MEAKRFVMFINRIDSMHKHLRRLRAELGSDADMKGVHTLWVYLLSVHPEGLTSAELAEVCSVDRSLISREIEQLRQNGIVELQEANGRRVYNSNVRLTARGMELAEQIGRRALSLQEAVDEGITGEELDVFYTVVEKMRTNFDKILKHQKGNEYES